MKCTEILRTDGRQRALRSDWRMSVRVLSVQGAQEQAIRNSPSRVPQLGDPANAERPHAVDIIRIEAWRRGNLHEHPERIRGMPRQGSDR